MTYQIGVINMHERVGSQAPQAFDYFFAIDCPIAIFVKLRVHTSDTSYFRFD